MMDPFSHWTYERWVGAGLACRKVAGLPEIDFVELRPAAQQIEPVAVGYPDEGFHWMVAEITGGE